MSIHISKRPADARKAGMADGSGNLNYSDFSTAQLTLAGTDYFA
jgi:hypothetical protein